MPPPQEPPNASKGLGGRFYFLLSGHGTSWWGRGDWLILYPGMPAGKGTGTAYSLPDNSSFPTGARNSRELLVAPQLPVLP